MDTAAGIPPDVIDSATLALVAGQSAARVESYLVTRGIAREDASAAVRAARSRITVAADYVRDEQLGKAVLRLEDMYAKALASKPPNTATALAAQKELNKILNLYDAPPPLDGGHDIDDTQTAQELRLVGSYLVPLGLASQELPVAEHARIAADLIRDAGLVEL